jgi:hypothetical protein
MCINETSPVASLKIPLNSPMTGAEIETEIRDAIRLMGRKYRFQPLSYSRDGRDCYRYGVLVQDRREGYLFEPADRPRHEDPLYFRHESFGAIRLLSHIWTPTRKPAFTLTRDEVIQDHARWADNFGDIFLLAAA